MCGDEVASILIRVRSVILTPTIHAVIKATTRFDENLSRWQLMPDFVWSAHRLERRVRHLTIYIQSSGPMPQLSCRAARSEPTSGLANIFGARIPFGRTKAQPGQPSAGGWVALLLTVGILSFYLIRSESAALIMGKDIKQVSSSG